MKIIVTQQDIDAARVDISHKGMLSERCPIAKAAARAFGKQDKYFASVDGQDIAFISKDEILHYTLSDEAVRFVNQFDKAQNVEPFEFESEVKR